MVHRILGCMKEDSEVIGDLDELTEFASGLTEGKTRLSQVVL